MVLKENHMTFLIWKLSNFPIFVSKFFELEKFFLTLRSVIEHVKTNYEVKFCTIKETYNLIAQEGIT